MADRKLALVFQFKGVDGLTPMMKGIIGAAGGAQGKLRALNATYKDQNKELKDLRATLATASGNVTELMNRERQLESQLAKTTKRLESQKAAMARVAKADNMGDSARSKGSQNLTTGAAIAAPLFLAGKSAAEFEDGMIDIRQKAGLSAVETKKLENNIVAAAKAAHQLPESMRAGVDTLAGFGMTPQEAGQMIAPIGRAATAYRAEIADLSAATYANFDNLDVPINQTARALDAMAQAGKSGAFELKDMAVYFPALTAQAKALGQSGVDGVADLSAALQIARKGAGDSAAAATNVQNLLAKINSEETEKKFAKMGVNLPKALKKAYAEGKTPLEAIAELTNQATGGDMSKVGRLFGDMQAQQALRPLIMNIAEYRKIREEAMKATGVVDEDFAMRAESSGTMFKALMGDMARIALVAGGALLPAFIEVSGHLRIMADNLATFAAENPQAVSWIVKTVAAVAGLNLVMGGARMAFGMVVGPAARLYNGVMMLGKLGPVFNAMIGFAPRIFQAFGIMRTAAIFLAQGVMRAGLMLLANPIILIITAIVAAVGIAGYLIYKNWDKIKAAFGEGLAYLTGLWAQFKTIGGNLMTGLIGGITEKVDAVKSLVLGIAGKVAGWFRGVLGIKSPSRVFMGFGGHIADGLAIGMDRSMKGPMKAAKALALGVAGAMTTTLPVAASPQSALSGTAISAAPAASYAAPAPSSIGNVTIQIYAAPGQSTQDIGAEVERRFNDLLRAQQARARSAYKDDDS